MKTKEIHYVLGVAPATFFDWNRPSSKKNNLAKLLKELDANTVLALLEKSKQKQKKPTMILYAVNQSIGDKSKHFTLTSLKNIFYKKEPLDMYEKYALNTIKNEAMDVEIKEFADYYKIPLGRLKKAFSQC
jgi:hypothetical protein